MKLTPARLKQEELDQIEENAAITLTKLKLLLAADMASPMVLELSEAMLAIPTLLRHIKSIEAPPADETLWERLNEMENLLLDVRAVLLAERRAGRLSPMLVALYEVMEERTKEINTKYATKHTPPTA